jgi:hypothetical protein
VEQWADLIICYNPFRPYLNDPHASGRVGSRYLSDRGLQTVMNQVLRTMLHTRLAMGLRSYMHDEHFRGDIVVIEARETDEKFFDLNPLEFWRRADAVKHGLDSVRKTLLDSSESAAVFARYGLESGPDGRRSTGARGAQPAPGIAESARRFQQRTRLIPASRPTRRVGRLEPLRHT